MYMWPNEIKEIVAEVLHAKNPITCFKKHINFPSAKNITFVLFDGNQATNFTHITHDYALSKYSLVDFGKGDSVTTTNNNIKNLGTPNKPETPSKPEADKPSEDKPSTPSTPTETPSTPEKPPTDKPSSGSSWDIYENNTPEENLEILAAKATRKLSLSRSAKDEVYIKYSAYHPEINFYSTLDSGGLSTSILAVYNTSTQKWAKVQFTIGGTTGAASMITESEFDPSSYTYGKDMNFKFVGDSPAYGFTGATEADINEVANTSFQTLWSGTGVILLRELKMQLKDIGFDQL